MSVERDRIVSDIMDLIRLDVQDLIYKGKNPHAIAALIAHTMGSARTVANYLENADSSSRPHDISQQDRQEIETVRDSIPEDVRPLFDAAVLSGAHPLSYARRIQEMIVASIADPEDEPQGWGL